MRWFLLVIAIMAFSFPAHARIEQRQKGDGTAAYVGSKGDTGACLGGAFLQFNLSFDKKVTAYMISPITNAMITNAWATHNTTTTGTATIRLYTGDNAAYSPASPVRFENRSANLTTVATIAVEAAAGGTVNDISTRNEVSGADGLIFNTVGGGETVVVTVHEANTAPANLSSVVLVQVCPR